MSFKFTADRDAVDQFLTEIYMIRDDTPAMLGTWLDVESEFGVSKEEAFNLWFLWMEEHSAWGSRGGGPMSLGARSLLGLEEGATW